MKTSDMLSDGGRAVGQNAAEKENSKNNFFTGLGWFDSLLPEGIPIPSSILISGPSGTGKPFVGLAFAASWLQQGGRVIFIPVHSSYPALFERGLLDLYGLSLEDFPGSHFFILVDTDLDPHEPAVEVSGCNTIRSNLVNPKAWREALAVASASLDGEGPILVFASALNLLLLSPSYGEQFFLMLLNTIRDTRGWTYLLTISSSILLKKSTILEQAADHLFLMKRVLRDRYLHLRAARVRNAAFCSDSVPVPVMPDFFEDLKNEAVASRRILIPKVSSI